MATQEERQSALESDIEERMDGLVSEFYQHYATVDMTVPDFLAFMRAAYGKGYCDALSEAERGKLCTDHGYKTPQRKKESDGRTADVRA